MWYAAETRAIFIRREKVQGGSLMITEKLNPEEGTPNCSECAFFGGCEKVKGDITY